MYATVMRHSTLALALALSLAAPIAFAGAERATAPGAATRPHELPNAQRMFFQGLEDEAIDIDVGVKEGSLTVVAQPKHGLLLSDRQPMKYVPSPDFSGLDEIEFVASTPTGESVPIVAQVLVLPVNDAPRFLAGSGIAHATRVEGDFYVEGWAKKLSAGPMEEAESQSVWFEVESLDRDFGVVEQMSIDREGNLKYVLGGRSGVAEWAVTMRDSGGFADGGHDASTAVVLRIGVGQVTDLSIKLLRPSGKDPGISDTYQLLVTNHGQIGVEAARVVDVRGPLSSGEWQCIGVDGGICGASAGFGAVDELVDLRAGTAVLYTVSGVFGAPTRSVAFVQPPDHVVDPDLANNEASD